MVGDDEVRSDGHGLVGHLDVEAVAVGSDFRFGRRRAGDRDTLLLASAQRVRRPVLHVGVRPVTAGREGEELARYGITRVYSPDDGRELGLQGMVGDMLSRSDFATGELGEDFENNSSNLLSSALFASAAERFPVLRQALNNISDALLFPNVRGSAGISGTRKASSTC